jgi:hypothetical protein
LRHTKIETTQKYYANIKQGSAGRQLKDVWKERPILAVPVGVLETPQKIMVARTLVIDQKYEISGYV